MNSTSSRGPISGGAGSNNNSSSSVNNLNNINNINSGNNGGVRRSSRRVSLNPRVHEHIPPEYLPNLSKYKYSGSDSSIIGRYIMQPYWNFIVSLVPMTVAPNAITLTGFCIGVSSSLLVMFFYFFCDAVYPPWVWYYAAAALFIYQTLDAIDGKQARRTQMCGPLGELFDHGCDAFLTPLVQVNISCALNVSNEMAFVFCTLSSCVLFAAIWEQFSTGSLDLGRINGPTEGILLACSIFLITGWYSTSIWDLTVIGPYEIVLPSLFGGGLFVISTIRSLFFVFFLISSALTIGTNILHVVQRPSVHTRGIPFLVAFPMFLILVLHVILFFTYSFIHDRYPFAFELSFGFLTSYTVTRMTVARLCAMPYNLFNGFYLISLFITLGALIVHMYFGWIENKYLKPSLGSAMVGLSALGVWQYLHMILSLFTQISYFFNIPILSIASQKERDMKRD
ncbi:aminoalcohol phosphotransferase [Trypanosoma theileri]|uniref:Aminoalcohol phosphotransferase n=1 Tax=Trypanosoma theileri TaxID=67003 RepID=A0A1X0NLI0_9TRYP|nr:aminoalcohol phosphotransferase [Trypanosoma theileri]ORC85622.1 aminoalcohol phosphotransferase [Trypanosoma theileri]